MTNLRILNSEPDRVREFSDLIDKYLSDHASYTFEVNRNKDDEYIFKLEKLSSLSDDYLNQSQAMTIVPTGSYWSYFLGCRDIFGIPLSHPNTRWIAFGYETTVEHVSRGAFLYLKAVFLPFPLSRTVLDGLEKIAGEISNPKFDDTIPVINKLELDCPGRKETRLNSRYPSSFSQKHIEGWAIRKARQEYENQKPFVFRTLAMKKSQLSTPGKPKIMITNKRIRNDAAFQD